MSILASRGGGQASGRSRVTDIRTPQIKHCEGNIEQVSIRLFRGVVIRTGTRKLGCCTEVEGIISPSQMVWKTSWVVGSSIFYFLSEAGQLTPPQDWKT